MSSSDSDVPCNDTIGDEVEVLSASDVNADDCYLEESLNMDEEFKNLPLEIAVGKKVPFGVVFSTISNYIVVKPLNKSLICDQDTPIFLSPTDNRVALKVRDVFGPITNPMYMLLVRPGFHDEIQVDKELFFSPDCAMFVSKESIQTANPLDVESGDDMEFSDDEKERLSKRKLEEGEL